jgi:hypothetical protein
MSCTYKIRDKNTGLFSNGIIKHRKYSYESSYYLGWSTRGKEWKNEMSIKRYLTKYIKEVGKIGNWEILEVIYRPTKELNDWIDSKMLLELMKHKN